jgi:hypothetical protein
MKHQRTRNIAGTSRKGHMIASRKKLIETFGEPCLFEPSTMEKVQIEWCLQFGDGTVATVYDWKQYGHIPDQDEEVQWNIGGRSRDAVEHVLDAVGLSSW